MSQLLYLTQWYHSWEIDEWVSHGFLTRDKRRQGSEVVWVFNFRSLTRPARWASIFEASRSSEQTPRERRCLASHWNWGALSNNFQRYIIIIKTITLVQQGWGSPAAHRGPSTSNVGFSTRARSPDHPSPLLRLCTCQVFDNSICHWQVYYL